MKDSVKAYSAMLRRDMQLYKRGLLPALVSALVLLLFCVTAAHSVTGGSSDFKRAQVALVDEENSILSGMTINLISGQSFTNSVMDITKTDKADAMSGLEDGRYSAVVVLPDGFVDATSGGAAMSGEILLSDGAQGYGDIVSSLAGFGQRLIATGQFGIFSGEMAIIDKYGRADEHSQYLSKVNILYLNEVLGASEKYFTREETDYRGSSMTLKGWYTLCYLMLFISLCPLLFSRMYSADLRPGIYRRLFSMGVRPGAFTSGKLLYTFIFALVIAAGGIIALKAVLMPAPGPGSVLLFALGIAFSCLVGMAVCICLPGKGTALICALSGAGLILCGGIIPSGLLPAVLETVGGFLPLGLSISMALPLFGAQPDALHIIALLLEAAICVMAIWLKLGRLLRGEEESV